MSGIFSSVNRKTAALFVCILLCVSLISCSQPDSTSSVTSGPATTHIRSVWAKNFAPGQLEAHYRKHALEFGDITQEEYRQMARILLNSAPGKDILEKKRANGDILHYRVSRGEFAVMTKSGRIRTYFKTDYQYWLKQ